MLKNNFNSLLSKVGIWTPEQIKEEVQGLALTYWIGANRRGTFEGATGVGKSKVGVRAVHEQFQKKADSIVYVLVPTESLRDVEWPEEFEKWGCANLLSKIKIICHASMQDILVETEIDLVIFDECHHATTANFRFFTNNKVWHILGLTATMPKNEPEKTAILNSLCPSCFKVSLEEATQLQLVSEFEVKVLFFDLNSVDLNVLGGSKDAPTPYTEQAYYDKLTKSLSKAMYRKDATEGMKFFWIQKRVEFIKNLKSREVIAAEVMKSLIKSDTRTLIFCGSIEQSNNLCGINTFNSKTDDTALKMFKTGQTNHLAAVNALDEGKNIPSIDQILVVCINSKDRSIIQRIGRSIRWREGHKALVAILVARGTADEKWYRTAFKDFDKKRVTEYLIKPS